MSIKLPRLIDLTRPAPRAGNWCGNACDGCPALSTGQRVACWLSAPENGPCPYLRSPRGMKS